MTTPQDRFSIDAMSDGDARSLLAQNHVGRLAFTLHGRVDIEPISYVVDGEWILFRTSEGHKAEILRHHPWVAFQTDEIRGRFDWQSVVVHGRVQNLPDDRSDHEREMRERAVAAIRQFDPDAASESDAFPHRNLILRLHIDELSGRRCMLRA